jgi:hypothetical protein
MADDGTGTLLDEILAAGLDEATLPELQEKLKQSMLGTVINND